MLIFDVRECYLAYPLGFYFLAVARDMTPNNGLLADACITPGVDMMKIGFFFIQISCGKIIAGLFTKNCTATDPAAVSQRAIRDDSASRYHKRKYFACDRHSTFNFNFG